MKPGNVKKMLKMGLIAATVVGGAVVAHATITSGLTARWKFTDGYGITAPNQAVWAIRGCYRVQLTSSPIR
jgi:hypothetical protein